MSSDSCGRALAVSIALICALAAACSKERKSPQFGEPVGIRVAASENVPALEVAVAVTQGTDIGPAVSRLSTAIHKSVKGCPGLGTIFARGEMVRVSFGIEEGKIAASQIPAEPQAQCVTKALAGTELLPKEARGDMMVEMRALAPEAAQ